MKEMPKKSSMASFISDRDGFVKTCEFKTSSMKPLWTIPPTTLNSLFAVCYITLSREVQLQNLFERFIEK